MRALALLLLGCAAACSVVRPDDLGRTACELDADCPNAGESCCDAFCRPSCSTPDAGPKDAGSDAGETPSDAGMPACSGDGVQCAPPQYSACRYAQTCATGGDRDRTDSVCSGGACLLRAPVTVSNDAACARSTDGVSCGAGLRCASGQCTCDATACAAAQGGGHGCCEGSTCVVGNSTSACGANGGACSVCASSQCCGASAMDSAFSCRLVCL